MKKIIFLAFCWLLVPAVFLPLSFVDSFMANELAEYFLRLTMFTWSVSTFIYIVMFIIFWFAKKY